MHDQHMTPERWVGSTVHVGAVGDEPQADFRPGAARSVYDEDYGDSKYGETPSSTTSLRGFPSVDLGETTLEDSDTDEADETDDIGNPESEQPFVAPAVEPAPPFLRLVGGFDEMFESIEDQWQERALCAQTDPEAFFPEKGGSTREAKRICLGCEVKDECLEYALAHDERFGIWGGLSERERRRLKRGII